MAIICMCLRDIRNNGELFSGGRELRLESAADDDGENTAGGKNLQDHHYQGSTSQMRGVAGADFEEDMINQKANTKSVNTRRVQKPDQK